MPGKKKPDEQEIDPDDIPRFKNGRPKSTRPAAARARVKKAVTKHVDTMNQEYKLLGIRPVSEWDMEELSRGRPRNLDGTFTGRPPAWVDPAIIAEARKRHKEVIRDDLRSYSHAALEVMSKLMQDDCVDPETGKARTPANVRLDAAKYVLNQAIGMPTASVEVKENTALHTLLNTVVVNPDGQPSYGDVIDAEVVEDEDD